MLIQIWLGRHHEDIFTMHKRKPRGECLVSYFVVTVLSKVTISRSKCQRARPKSDEIMKTRIVLRNRMADNSYVIALDGKRLNDDNSCHCDTIHVSRVNNKMHRVIIIHLFIDFQLVSEENLFSLQLWNYDDDDYSISSWYWECILISYINFKGFFGKNTALLWKNGYKLIIQNIVHLASHYFFLSF